MDHTVMFAIAGVLAIVCVIWAFYGGDMDIGIPDE